jgi:hypothetical protein
VNEGIAHRTFTLVKMILVVVVFFLGTYYFTISFTTQDLTWFRRGFDDLPYRVVIHNTGQKTEFRSVDPGNDRLAQAIRQSLDEGVARQSGVGLSANSLDDAYNRYLTVEAFFSQPVKLHAPFYTGHPIQMLIPITGRHSELSVVFLGGKNGYNVNAPALKTIQPLRDALVPLGYP